MPGQQLTGEIKQTALELNSGWNKLGLVKGLTREEMQILCDLELDDKKQHNEIELEIINNAIKHQRILAGDLAERFEGSEDTSRDESLHKRYWNQAHPKAQKDNQESQTAKIYTNHSKYSEIRLFLSRVYKVITTLPKVGEQYLKSLDDVKITKDVSLAGFIPKVFGMLGLSYGLRLGADIGIVLYTTFRKPRYTLNLLSVNSSDEIKTESLDHHPHLIAIKGNREGEYTYKIWGCRNNQWQLTNLDNFVPPQKWPLPQHWKEKKEVIVHSGEDTFNALAEYHLPREATLTRWQRFKNVMRKGERLQRMEHDAIWFGINVASVVLSFLTLGPIGPLISASLGMSGTGLDVIREIRKSYADYKKYKNLAAKFEAEINEVDEQLLLASHKPNSNIEEVRILNDKRQELKLLKNKVEEKSRSRNWERVRPVIISTLLVIGLAFMVASVLFPPLAIPGGVLAGAGISLVAGSVLSGLGKRIAGTVVDFGKWATKKVMGKENHEQESKNNNTDPSLRPLIPNSASNVVHNTATIRKAVEENRRSTPPIGIDQNNANNADWHAVTHYSETYPRRGTEIQNPLSTTPTSSLSPGHSSTIPKHPHTSDLSSKKDRKSNLLPFSIMNEWKTKGATACKLEASQSLPSNYLVPIIK